MPRQRVLALKTDGKGKPGRPTKLQEEARRRAIEAVAPHVADILNVQVQRAIEDGRTGAARLCLEVAGVVGTHPPSGNEPQMLAAIVKAMEVVASLAPRVRETSTGGFVIDTVDAEYSEPEALSQESPGEDQAQ